MRLGLHAPFVVLYFSVKQAAVPQTVQCQNQWNQGRRMVNFMVNPQTCETAVPNPLDAPPIRSPQAVHSYVVKRIKGKEIVEIGTRNGDGMSCFTLHAKKATAIEMARSYCTSLESRSAAIAAAHPGRGFKVTCSDYRRGGVVDADIITWWEQAPLTNVPALQHLLREQKAGRLRAGASAIILFDPKWGPDMWAWNRLCPLATWSARIPFDERPRCVQKNGGKSPQGSETCDRAFGVFILAGVPIDHVPMLDDKSLDSKACIARHEHGWAAATGRWQEYDVPFQGGRRLHASLDVGSRADAEVSTAPWPLSAASVVGAARPDAPSIGAGAAGLFGAAMGAVALIVGLAAAITQRRRRPAQPLA